MSKTETLDESIVWRAILPPCNGLIVLADKVQEVLAVHGGIRLDSPPVSVFGDPGVKICFGIAATSDDSRNYCDECIKARTTLSYTYWGLGAIRLKADTQLYEDLLHPYPES